MIQIKLLKKEDLTPHLATQLSPLYKQLNTEIKQLSLAEIFDNAPHTDVAIALEKDILVGIAMMAKYKVISGHKGMIEDVVVAENARGKGIGKQLMQCLLEQAKHLQLDSLLLFSGHHRTTAIALYKSLGFTLKNSGLYTKQLL